MDNLWTSSNKVKIEKIEKVLNEKGLKLPFIQEYKDSKTRLVLEDIDGYRYSMNYGNIYKNYKTLQKFSTRNPYSIYNLKLWTMKYRSNWEVLSAEYPQNRMIHFYNKEYDINVCMRIDHYLKFQDGDKISRLKLRLSIEEMQQVIKNKLPNIIILKSHHDDINKKCTCRCIICHNEFKALYSNLTKGEGCPQCGLRKGENHGCWKGGITPLYNNIRSAMILWKVDSYNKYNYRCDITGEKLKSNVIHHHHNYSDILQETISILNMEIKKNISDYTLKELELIKNKCLELHYKYGLGICLKEELHKEFHSIYGQKNNTIEQYLEFKQNKLKEMEVTVNER